MIRLRSKQTQPDSIEAYACSCICAYASCQCNTCYCFFGPLIVDSVQNEYVDGYHYQILQFAAVYNSY